jgi:glycosyltransferase involved in cell wall biosynthesis
VTFSIRCTAYQTQAYLAETVESVLAQTSPDWQLIVVDNRNVRADRRDRAVLPA